MPSRKPFRPVSIGGTLLFASTLALALCAALPLPAQKPPADMPSTTGAPDTDSQAYRALQEGRADDATNLLRASLAANPSDAVAHQLFCRVAYAQNQADSAVSQCQMAVADDPSSSDDQLWLGRAYGMKARHAGPIAGFSLARKVQASFARAVQLDPTNVAALNDLGEYYVAAPFIVGGGSEKARALAAKMMPNFPAAAHRLLARIADSGGDLGLAESQFKQAVAVQRSPEAWIDLAHFYQTHGRGDDALATIKSAIAADRAHDAVLVDAASILTAAHRDPDLAERCLRDYLASNAKSDAAPAFKVHLQLGRLLAAKGDAEGAHKEVETAAALAPGFTHGARSARDS